MILPLLAARDWDKKNPDLEGNEGPPAQSFGDALLGFGGGSDDDTCKECGKPLDEDDEKKRGK